MMDESQRTQALAAMRMASSFFYAQAVRIGNHPFIEFAGLMNEYIQACEDAQAQGVDFTECTAHTGRELPLAPYRVGYLNEKLECIFGGRIQVTGDT